MPSRSADQPTRTSSADGDGSAPTGVRPAALHRVTRWRNGGGSTAEVVVHPRDVGPADFAWRVSIADLAGSGPFSAFPGADRIFTLATDARADFTVDGARHQVARYQPFSFSGDSQTDCQLTGGPAWAVNVMTRRGTATATIHVFEAREPVTPAPDAGGATVLVVLDGTGTANVPSAAPSLLAPRDAVVADLGTPPIQFIPTGEPSPSSRSSSCARPAILPPNRTTHGQVGDRAAGVTHFWPECGLRSSPVTAHRRPRQAEQTARHECHVYDLTAGHEDLPAVNVAYAMTCGSYESDVILGLWRSRRPRDFDTWLSNLKRAGGPALSRAAALLAALRRLPEKPVRESATFKRVRQARRHELWRAAHPFDPQVAVRIICWFPDLQTIVVALVGGDKRVIGDIWYDSATVRAEAAVDQWLRENSGRMA